MKKIITLLIAVLPLIATEYINGYKEFELINPESTRNIDGDFTIIGNTVQGVTKCKRIEEKEEIKDCEIARRNNKKYYNNHYLTRFFYDNNSSTAYLKLPSYTKRVVWAAINWQGHINNYSYQKSNIKGILSIGWGGYDKYYLSRFKSNKSYFKYYKNDNGYYYELSNDLPNNNIDEINSTDANKINLDINGTTYTIIADTVHYEGKERYFCIKDNGCKKKDLDNPENFIQKNGVTYNGYKVLDEATIQALNDNISLAKTKKGLPITISNIKTTWGLDLINGDYGAWNLIVIYETDEEDVNSKFKNINIFSGFTPLSKGDLNITVSNLILPQFGEIKSSLAIFAAEGEESLDPDYVELNGKLLNEKNSDANNIFDSYLSDEIKREPKLKNNNGIDIDIFDTSKEMGELRDDENATEYNATITVHTDSDMVLISHIAFATDLYKPKLCYLETFYNSDGIKIEEASGKILIGDIITVDLLIRNKNDKDAKKVTVYTTFENNASEYVENSTEVKNVGESDYIPMSDSLDEDLVYYDLEEKELNINLGLYANGNMGGTFYPDNEAYSKFKIEIKDDKNISLTYKARYEYTIGHNTFYINATLPKCEEFNNTITPYRPQVGFYNVVEPEFNSNKDPIDLNNPLNWLKTKVVNKEFNVTLLHLDDDKESLLPIENYVRLELINSTQSNNKSCKELELLKDMGIYSFNNTSSTLVNNKVNFVNRSTSYRVKYIDWDEAIALARIDCNSLEFNLEIKGVPECVYKNEENFLKVFPSSPCLSEYGEPCNKENRGVGSEPYDDIYGCLNCILDHHGKDVCARDNFAIRPYGFVLFSKNSLKRAADDINITIKAVDEGNFTLSSGDIDAIKHIKDYNESLYNTYTVRFEPSIYQPTPNEARQMNQDIYNISDSNITRVAKCPNKGVITPTTTSFTNGLLTTTIKYIESGVIEINLSEEPDSEFAVVDKNDTPDSLRYIKPATVITDPEDISKKNLLVVVPYQFSTQATTDTSTKSNWLYISNEVKKSQDSNTTPKMAASINYKIIAKNKDGATLQNYTKSCFADDTPNAPQRNGLKLNSTFGLNLDFKLQADKNSSLNFYTEDNSSNAIELITQNLTILKDINTSVSQQIKSKNFELGRGEAKVYFNIERNVTKPINPTKITIIDANTSTTINKEGITNIFNGATINNPYYFYYGRLHIPQQRINGNIGKINSYYEIFLDENGVDLAHIKGSVSVDDIYWFKNLSHQISDGNITTPVNTIIDLNQIELLEIFPVANSKQPLKLKYLGNIFPYANYIKLDTYEWLLFDKYDENITQVTSRVEFIKEGDWLGKGKDFSGDSEFKPSKNESFKILW